MVLAITHYNVDYDIILDRVRLVSSPLHGLDDVVGPVGPITGHVLIIRTIQFVELVEYFISVKNHVDQISVVTRSEQILVNNLF